MRLCQKCGVQIDKITSKKILKGSTKVRVVSAMQVVLRNAVTAYYRIMLRPSDDFDNNILYKMVWDRRPILKVMSEKVSSLEYVRTIVPDIAFAHRYYETQDLSAINWESLPRNFVIKASHGSGGVIIVHEGAPKENRLPKQTKKFGWRRFEVHPDNFEHGVAIEMFSRLLKSTYGQGLNRGGPEWGYWGNKPHVIIEDFLSQNGQLPARINCNVVHGQIYLLYWERVNFTDLGKTEWIKFSTFLPPIYIPDICKEIGVTSDQIEKLLDLSLQIAGDMDFLRVDWFLSDKGIFISELTNYCGGGAMKGQSYFQLLGVNWRPHRSDYLSSPKGGEYR